MGWILIIIAIVLHLLNLKKPSERHDPKAFKKHDGLKSVIGGIFMIGLTIVFIQGC